TEGGSAYERMEHPAGHRALCGVAAWVVASSGGIERCRLAATGVGAQPRRLEGAEQAAVGTDGTAAAVTQAIAGEVAGWGMPGERGAGAGRLPGRLPRPPPEGPGHRRGGRQGGGTLDGPGHQ